MHPTGATARPLGSRHVWLISAGVFLSALAVARAQAPPAPEAPLRLPPVVVTAPRVATPLLEVPAAISVVEQEAIQLGQQTIGLDEALGRVPGVFPQNRFNFAQDLRLSIRGFGARAAFGIRGIKILVDGIPETLPDGQSQVDSLDLGSAQRIEVLRGPTSALYGNASGGVISILTEDGPPRPFVEARTLHGEFGLWKAQLKSGGQVGPLNYLLSVSRLELGGFRDLSRTESVVVNGKFRFDLDAVSSLTALLSLVDSPRADDPGGLTQEEVAEDRRQAAPNNLRFRTGEEVAQQRLGLVYRRELLPGHELEVTGFYAARQFRNSIPFQVVDFDRTFLGGGLKYIYRGRLLGRRQRLTVGIDVQHQDDRRRNFDNVDGQPGETLRLHQDERVTSVGPYAQVEFSLFDPLTLVLGARYDNVRFAIDDFLLSDGDDTGARTFDQLTGRFGLLFNPLPAANFYVTIAQSFETPTTTELVNRPGGGGGINPEIEPQQAINYEVGVKGLALGRLQYEAALFFIFLRDELIRFEDPTGRAFFRNAGKSRRFGAELGLRLELLEGLRLSLAYTYLNAVFTEFVKEGVDLEDNEVPGLPPHQVYAELFYRHRSGFYGGLDLLYVSEFFADDENTVTNEAYAVANLRLGLERRLGPWQLAPFFGIQNLFDEKYNSNVRINATGGRFFEPAPGFNVYGGLTVAYNW
ncbi:MAG: TonB-dependent receptor [Candidatus Tectimicrobiota bacterium]|nr:MAG: TonB-dependent receptor [Candidatus Tectomicrobia bacterium]